MDIYKYLFFKIFNISKYLNSVNFNLQRIKIQNFKGFTCCVFQKHGYSRNKLNVVYGRQQNLTFCGR